MGSLVPAWGAVRSWALVLVAAIVAACGGGGGGGGGSGAGVDPDTGRPGADYFPLAVGDRWSYLQTGTGALLSLRVVGTRVSQGINAFVLRADSGSGVTEQLYAKTSAGVVALADDGADPVARALAAIPVLRLPVTAGDTRVELNQSFPGYFDFDGDGRLETLGLYVETTVVGFESLTTAAGTLSDVAHLRTIVRESTTLTASGSPVTVTLTSDDWYAPDLGPVRSVLAIAGGGVNESSDHSLFAYRVGARQSERIAPTVISKTPADGSEGRSALIRVNFSEPMDRLAGSNHGFSLTGPDGQPVAGQFSWADDRSFDFVADAFLLSGAYTARVDTAAEDLAGNALAAPQSWQFVVDGKGPTLVSMVPAADAVEVPLDSVVRLTFDEELDPATVSAASFTLRQGVGSVAVPAAVTLDGRTVTVAPLAALQPGHVYVLDVHSWVADRLGNTTAGFTTYFKTDPGRFAAPRPVFAGAGFVDALAIGDLNGDGRKDLAVVGDGNGDPVRRVRVLAQETNGGLSTPVLPDIGVSCTPTSLSASDADGDGRVDLAVGTYCGVVLLRQNAQGSLVAMVLPSFASTLTVRQVMVAADGRMGIVGTGFDGAIRLWRQVGPGVFGSPVALPGVLSSVNDVDLADFDGDGRTDLVLSGRLASTNGSGIAILHQLADGSFGHAQEIVVDLNHGTAGVASGDLNGDGRPDIVFSTGGNSPTVIGIVLQQPGGTWGPVGSMSTYDIPAAIRVADIDGDGRDDVVVSHVGWLAVGLYLQRSDGTLAPELRFESTYGSWGFQSLAVGDLTGDGLPDIVSSDALLRQRPQPAGALEAPGRSRAWRLAVPRLPDAQTRR